MFGIDLLAQNTLPAPIAKWFAYGEDRLTYWALRNRLDRILARLDAASDPADAVRLYRPSFGRGGGANFGEFDAIIATANAIYPIEAEWAESAEVHKFTIEVENTQINRHKIFAWYPTRYAAFPGKKLAPVE